uniref:Sugar phosphate phosphatase n=1 Tax=Strigamia maritima TaxID=126957 RepID=T1JPB2_STRMM
MNNIPPSLSASFELSFAYITLRDRIPVIITKIIDQLHRDKNETAITFGPGSKEEVKEIIGRLAKLKNEITTDKPLVTLQDDFSDTIMWNKSIEELTVRETKQPTWFATSWLYDECYMYRRIFEAFQLSNTLKKIDCFQKQKEDSVFQSAETMAILGAHLINILNNINNAEELKSHFNEMLQISLWSNRCDLSIAAGAERAQKDDPIKSLNNLSQFILVNNSQQTVDHIINVNQQKSQGIRIDIILDNSGFELFCDFCLAHFLCAAKLVNRVHFYVKCMPWFVSDTTAADFEWLLNTLDGMNDPVLNDLGGTWKKYVNDGIWSVQKDLFWTLPYDYSEMKKYDSNLYERLSHADLLIFKGDLNYRKLTGDRKWNSTIPFETALRGFNPSPLCALRTLKADTVVGLAPGQAEAKEITDTNWMIKGDYAVIQFNSNKL